MIRSSVNTYYANLDRLSENQMFDVENQRDMARKCINEIERTLALWKNQRMRR